MYTKHLIAALALAMSLAAPVAAQESSGGIVGEARTGDVIEITGAENGVHRTLTQDKDGKFNFRRLPTGTYDVVITHADGTTEAKVANVRAGGTARVQ